MISREEVFEAINSERAYQNIRWNESTTQSRGVHTEYEWLLFIQDYLIEAIHIASREPEPQAREKVLHHIRKITAMGVACMEQNGALRREGY